MVHQIQPVYDEDGRLLWNRWSNGLKVFFESENLDVEQGPHGDVRLSVPYDLIRFEPTPEDHALLVIECDICEELFPWQPNCEECGEGCLLCADCCAARFTLSGGENSSGG